ncbi:MAG: hypothetical protein QOE70_349, partial [Chthoniobacter sp.]|nr:hypothetical protein [Chthoniobacter sp.]
TLADVLDAIQQQSETLADLGTRMEASEQFQNDVIAQLQGEGDNEGEDQLTDEQIDALVEAGQLIDDGAGNLVWAEGADLGGGEGDLAGAGAGAGAGPGGGAAVAAMNAGQRALRGVIALESRIAAQARRDQQAREQHAFATVDAKIQALAAQNAELIEALEQSEAANQGVSADRKVRRQDAERWRHGRPHGPLLEGSAGRQLRGGRHRQIRGTQGQWQDDRASLRGVRGYYAPLDLQINGLEAAPNHSNEEIQDTEEQAHADVLTIVMGAAG